MTAPKVTVIMPAYNSANFIRNSIESVLNQKYNDFELIVVDDGSTDNTSEVAGSFKDPRIKCYRKESGGPASARNTGIKFSAGDYIAFIDSDDRWNNDHLSLLVNYLDAHVETGMVYSKEQVFDESGIALGTHGEPFDKVKLEHKYLFFTSTVLLRRKCIDQVGLFDESPFLRQCHEDYEFYLRFSDKFPIDFIDIITVSGMKHPEGAVKRAMESGNYFKGKAYLINKRLEIFKKHPRGEILTPVDTYYFYLLHNMNVTANWIERNGVKKALEVLRGDVLPIFEDLKGKDPQNLEIYLVLALLYFRLMEKSKVIEIAKQAEVLLNQVLQVNDKEMLRWISLSLGSTASVLSEYGEQKLASRFREKAKEFPPV